jgi:hypothetical protein
LEETTRRVETYARDPSKHYTSSKELPIVSVYVYNPLMFSDSATLEGTLLEDQLSQWKYLHSTYQLNLVFKIYSMSYVNIGLGVSV